MNLKTKLEEERTSKIEEYALEFAEDLEPRLLESARKGFSAYVISLEGREDTHLLKNPLFISYLNELLEGCQVKLKSSKHTNLIFKNQYTKYRLVINW